MKAALLAAAALLLAAPAWALPGSITADVRDEKTGRPLDGFVFAREKGEIGKIHGSTTVCMRASVGPVVGGKAKLHLPLPSPNPLVGRRRFETIAYSPAHCVGQGNADGQTLQLKPAAQSPHERLMYLHELAGALLCPDARWGDGSDAAMAQLAEAVDRELKPLERDAFGRKMARKVRESLDHARSKPPASPYRFPDEMMKMSAREFAFAPANHKVPWEKSREPAIVALPAQPPRVMSIDAPRGNRPGNAVGVVGGSSGSQPLGPPPGPLAIHCRHGTPSACDYDERSEAGETPLGEMIRFLKEEHVKLLLAAGADPGVPVVPGGPKAVEALAARMLNVVPRSRDADSVKEILELLVAHPKASLPARLKADLALDPKEWQEVRNRNGVSLLEQHREALAALPAHADPEIGCYSLGVADSSWRWLSVPVRLRVPRNPPIYPPTPPIRPDLRRKAPAAPVVE